MKLKLAIALVSTSVLAMSQGQAFEDIPHNGNKAYVWDSYGSIVRDQFGGCVRSIEWTKQTAIAQCEGWVEEKAEPKKPVVAPMVKAEPVKAAPAAAAPVAEPASSQKMLADKPMSFTGLFANDSAKLSESARNDLDDYVIYLKANSDKRLVVTGHTDSKGRDAYNQKLSERRAAAVKSYLVENGVDAAQVQTFGKGETQPVAENTSAEGRAQNRRVDIEIKAR